MTLPPDVPARATAAGQPTLPADTQVLHQSAAARLSRGDLPGALALLEQATQSAPDVPELWNDLGGVQAGLGRPAEAEQSFQRALALRPDYIEARLNLGQVQYGRGDREAALATFSAVAAEHPDNVLALYSLGVVQKEQGDLEAAHKSYTQVLAADPGLVPAQYNLAQLNAELRRFEAATTGFRETLRLAPGYVEARLGLGRSLVGAWFTAEGARELEAYVQARPQSLAGRLELAQALQIAGRFTEAEAQCRTALDLDAASAAAWYRLSSLVKFDEARLPEVERMEALLADGRQGEEARTSLLFALGKAWDDLGDYARAFDYYRQGNALKKASFPPPTRDHGALVDDIIRVFTPETYHRLLEWGARSERPVLVFGMPRSGTTLTEQILASHPQAHGAGELSYFPSVCNQLHGLVPGLAAFPAGVTALDAATVGKLTTSYLGLLQRHSATALRVVDKMPGNYLYLGLIAGVLPQARLIHCRRDPVDTCLSMYFQLFGQGHDYSFDLATLGERYRLYRRLMRHWQGLFGDRIHEHSYEALLDAPEPRTRALLAAAGLDWRPECLAFHQSRRDVRTASISQVRQPLYAKSKARWRHYEPWLGPLLEALEGAD